ncbi:unnamed protein product [Leptosia nina]|uniref:Uncharacterized protein n=1 Tax=Leptosia nina TaxID=320188 RepID=A0AAV1JQ98_9NEOP
MTPSMRGQRQGQEAEAKSRKNIRCRVSGLVRQICYRLACRRIREQNNSRKSPTLAGNNRYAIRSGVKLPWSDAEPNRCNILCRNGKIKHPCNLLIAVASGHVRRFTNYKITLGRLFSAFEGLVALCR